MNRKELKSIAKNYLKKRYWIAVVASLIVAVFNGEYLGGGFATHQTTSPNRWQTIQSFYEQNQHMFILLIIALAFIGLVLFAIAIAYNLFIVNPLLVGKKRFYLENRGESPEIGRIFSLFGQHYLNVVYVMFRKNLSIFLWSLLLIVPGIIKAIEYSFISYQLAQDPSISYVKAKSISRALTSGQKWNIVALILSFIGWIVLCVLSAGLGFIFLNPYMEQTYAELYVYLSSRSDEPGETLKNSL